MSKPASPAAKSRARLTVYETELSRELWWKSFELCGVLELLDEIATEEQRLTDPMRGAIGAALRIATDVKDSISRMDDEFDFSPKAAREARARAAA